MNLLRVTQFKDGEQSSFIVEDKAATRRKVLHWLHNVDAVRIERTTPELEVMIAAADEELANAERAA